MGPKLVSTSRLSGARNDEHTHDRRIAARVAAALGDAASVLNVGAGSGNYEPTDRRVIALEPSMT